MQTLKCAQVKRFEWRRKKRRTERKREREREREREEMMETEQKAKRPIAKLIHGTPSVRRVRPLLPLPVPSSLARLLIWRRWRHDQIDQTSDGVIKRRCRRRRHRRRSQEKERKTTTTTTENNELVSSLPCARAGAGQLGWELGMGRRTRGALDGQSGRYRR